MARRKITYAAAESFARSYDSHLNATDPRFRKSVYVIHEEGTVLFFEFAFAARRREDPYIYVFTEHHGFHIYPEDDVTVAVYSREHDLEEIA